MKCIYKNIVIIATVITIMMNSIVFGQPKLETVGESILLIEYVTGSVIYSKEPDKRMFPASTTKMLTALVTLDYLAPDELVTVGEEIKNLPPNSSTAEGIIATQTLTVENALKGLLLSSGNDLSLVLALNVAQKKENKTNMSYNESEKIFATLMNEKAKALGAVNSNFINPHGYHDENHYTTARDLYIIAKALLSNALLSEIVGLEKFTGDGADRSVYADKKIAQYSWKNSNSLISSSTYKYDGATGIKTGSTDEAGKCLVASAEKEGKKLIAVILNATEAGRWQDARKLFDYGFDNFEIATLQKKGEKIATVPLQNEFVQIKQNGMPDKATMDIVASEDINAFVNLESLDSITSEVSYYKEVNTAEDNQTPRLILPLKSGQAIGIASYKIGDEIIFQTEVKASSDRSVTLKNDRSTAGFKKAVSQKRTRTIINFIVKGFITILVLAVVFAVFCIVRIRMIRRRRRMRMRMRKRRQTMRSHR